MIIEEEAIGKRKPNDAQALLCIGGEWRGSAFERETVESRYFFSSFSGMALGYDGDQQSRSCEDDDQSYLLPKNLFPFPGAKNCREDG